MIRTGLTKAAALGLVAAYTCCVAQAATTASRTVAAGSHWVVSAPARLNQLVIAAGARISATDGYSLSMTVNGIGTTMAPGTYTGAVVLMPTRRLSLGAGNGGPHDFRAAVVVNDGKRVADQSVASALISGTAGDRIASDLRIDSREEKFNGVLVTGDSNYVINGAIIDMHGNGGNDFAGYGAAVMSSGGARLTVNHARIRTVGAVRTALYIGGKSTMWVNDSDIEVQNGTLPADYQFSIQPGKMMEVPYGLGLSGNVRATNLIDEATVYYNRSRLKSNGWGVLSSDGGGPTRMFVKDCSIETVGSGYGAYANGDAHDYFSHSTLDVADVGIIIGGYGSATLTDGTIIRSKKLGVFMHQGTGGSVLSVLGKSEIRSHNTAVQIKGRGGDVVVDNALLQADNGILIQTMDSDDPIMRAMIGGGGGPPPRGGPPGGDLPGAGEPLTFSKDVHATIRNTELSGDVVHALTSMSDMTVTLQRATLTGAISTGVAKPESGKAPDRETFRNVGLVVNELGPSPTAHTLKVFLDWQAKWVVTKPSFVDGLVIAEGAQLTAPSGAALTMSVDGVTTPIKPGSYSGRIVLRPLTANAPSRVIAKKRILLVTTSIGFRHPSVPIAERAIRAIARESGEFEIVSTSDSPDYPQYPAPMNWELAGKANAGPPPGIGPPPAMPAPVAGSAGSPETLEKVRKVLAQYLSADRLAQYDAVFFAVTNGELPLPDPQAFLGWIRAGHGYLGAHSASDTLHTLPGYVEMLGAEFDHHGQQEIVKLEVNDPHNPMAERYAAGLIADEEWYLMKSGYNRAKVHSLISMTEHPNDKTPGHYPVSWCKSYDQGRVFYTSQGHRPDIWDADWIGTDGKRTNKREAVAAFRHSLLQAMRWTTGLIEADCRP